MKRKETLVLFISRKKPIPSELMPAFKVIIPMLELVGPLEVMSSHNQKFPKPIYEHLVKYLSSESAIYPLEHIIEQLLLSKRRDKFRVCVVGEEDLSWKLILECKRHQVVVDVAGKNAYLPFWTGGIHRPVIEREFVSAFIQDFAVDTELRRVISTSRSKAKSIEFTVNCICCDKRIQEAYLCSSCLAIYCLEKSKTLDRCTVCAERFNLGL